MRIEEVKQFGKQRPLRPFLSSRNSLVLFCLFIANNSPDIDNKLDLSAPICYYKKEYKYSF